MKDELKLYGLFILLILFMVVTYKGSAEEQAARYVPSVEAKESVPSEYPELGGIMAVPEPRVLPSSEPVIRLDDGEIELALQLMAVEAKEEDVTGQALVLCTALNRVKNEAFPDNLYDVVMQVVDGYYQFTPVKDGSIWTAEPTEDTYKALEMVLAGWDKSRGATYFCTPAAAKKWHDDNLDPLFSYGKHKFYKE